MPVVRARLADEAWAAFLTGQHGDAVVGSAYPHTINVCLAGGELLWIAADGATPAPNALLTDAACFGSVAAGQPVQVVGAATLAIGALTVDLRHCRTFSCRTEPSDPGDEQVAAGYENAAVALDRHGVAGGMLHRDEEPADAFRAATHARLLSGAAALQAALAARDATGAAAAACAVIGLGIGSTPSGDDYLLGVLAVLLLHARTHRFGRRFATALRPACTDTTAVSRSYLLAACDGRFPTAVTSAVEAIFRGGQTGIDRATARLTALGATSGTDSMVGILDTVATVTVTGRKPWSSNANGFPTSRKEPRSAEDCT